MKKIGLLLILLMAGCSGEKSGKKISPQPEISFRHDADVAVIRGENDTLARFKTEIADDYYERETGLMYRKQMKDDRAMLFVFPDEQVRYFYMKNTYIPLDIIYADGKMRIVSIAHNAVPLDETPLSSVKEAKYVLEIKGGLCERLGIAEGDRLNLKKHE
jgi:uncharacterized membrane protein (UPF0127 family)